MAEWSDTELEILCVNAVGLRSALELEDFLPGRSRSSILGKVKRLRESLNQENAERSRMGQAASGLPSILQSINERRLLNQQPPLHMPRLQEESKKSHRLYAATARSRVTTASKPPTRPKAIIAHKPAIQANPLIERKTQGVAIADLAALFEMTKAAPENAPSCKQRTNGHACGLALKPEEIDKGFCRFHLNEAAFAVLELTRDDIYKGSPIAMMSKSELKARLG